MKNFLLKLLKETSRGSYVITAHDYKSIDPDLLHQLYKFRYQIYCEVDKLLNKDDYPQGIENDKFDEYSVFLIARNKKREIIGMIRLIKNSQYGFPTEDEFELNNIADFDKKVMLEPSRLIVRPDYRDTLLLYNLYKAAYLYSKNNNFSFWIACVEEWLLNSLEKFIGKLELAGDPHFCFNATNYPFVINLESIEQKVKKKNLFLYAIIKIKSKKIVL